MFYSLFQFIFTFNRNNHYKMTKANIKSNNMIHQKEKEDN